MPGETSYERDRAWADRYKGQVRDVLKECGQHFLSFPEADLEADTGRATDFVVRVVGGDIAVRIRSSRRTFRDLTIRTGRASGVETELAKILKGYPRWYLYCWTAEDDSHITEYALIDLDRCRDCGVLLKSRKKRTADGGQTQFISIPVSELREADCVAADHVTSAVEPPLPPEVRGHYQNLPHVWGPASPPKREPTLFDPKAEEGG